MCNIYKKAWAFKEEYKGLFIYGKLDLLEFDRQKTMTMTKTMNGQGKTAFLSRSLWTVS